MNTSTNTTKDPRAVLQDISQRLSMLHHTFKQSNTKNLTENVISGALLNVEDVQQDLVPLMQYCEEYEGFLRPLQEKLNNGPEITSMLFDLLLSIDGSGKIQEHLFNQLLNENGQIKEKFVTMGEDATDQEAEPCTPSLTSINEIDTLTNVREKLSLISMALAQTTHIWDARHIAGLDRVLMEVDDSVKKTIEQLSKEVV